MPENLQKKYSTRYRSITVEDKSETRVTDALAHLGLTQERALHGNTRRHNLWERSTFNYYSVYTYMRNASATTGKIPSSSVKRPTLDVTDSRSSSSFSSSGSCPSFFFLL